MAKQNQLIRLPGIESRIHLIRGHKVMFDADLAELYGVETKALIKAVKRNRERFPDDFMFQIDRQEVANLRFQIGTSNSHGGRRFLPYVFTREGIGMLSGVLRSQRAVAVNIEIMRAFVRMGEFLATQVELAAKLARLERKFGKHDKEIQAVFDVLKKLMAPPTTPKRPRREIGFHTQLQK